MKTTGLLKYKWLYQKAFHIHWVAYDVLSSIGSWFYDKSGKSLDKYKATIAKMDEMQVMQDKRDKPRKDAEFIESVFTKHSEPE